MYLAYNWRRFAVFQFLLASSALQHCKVFEITDLVLLKFPLPDSFPSMQLSPTNYIRLVVTGYVPTNGQFVAVNFRPLLLLSVENACFAVSHNFTKKKCLWGCVPQTHCTSDRATTTYQRKYRFQFEMRQIITILHRIEITQVKISFREITKLGLTTGVSRTKITHQWQCIADTVRLSARPHTTSLFWFALDTYGACYRDCMTKDNSNNTWKVQQSNQNNASL